VGSNPTLSAKSHPKTLITVLFGLPRRSTCTRRYLRRLLSSELIEKLTLRHAVSRYIGLLSKMKHFLADAQKTFKFDPAAIRAAYGIGYVKSG
jgi:hypothetical protein